jgi:hypothetical protein
VLEQIAFLRSTSTIFSVIELLAITALFILTRAFCGMRIQSTHVLHAALATTIVLDLTFEIS